MTGNFPGCANATSNYSSNGRQLRWICNPIATSVAAAEMPANVPMRFARFRFTINSTWDLDTEFALVFMPEAELEPGIIPNRLFVYCNSNLISTTLNASDGGIQFRDPAWVYMGSLLATTAFKGVASASAFPNPFVSSFKVDGNFTSGNVTVKVYDMLGKLIESREIKATDLPNQDFGSQYKSGVYNVQLSQGDEHQTLRIVRQ
jgi:hypothetical protein